MIRKIVEYSVQEEKVDQVRHAIAEFVGAVCQNELGTFYEAYETNKGNLFIHYMAFADEAAEKRHQSADYTRSFNNLLADSCLKQPVYTRINLLRSTDGE